MGRKIGWIKADHGRLVRHCADSSDFRRFGVVYRKQYVCAIGSLARAITMSKWIDFFWSFVGNLLGSLGIAWLITQAGVVGQAPQSDLLLKVASVKMNGEAWELFVRGIPM